MPEKFQVFLRYRHHRTRLRPSHLRRCVRDCICLCDLSDRLKSLLESFETVIADVDIHLAGSRDRIRDGSALDYAHIDKESMFKIMKFLDLDDLISHLQDRIPPALRVISRVGRNAVYGECHSAGTFSSDNKSVIEKSRLKVERRRASRTESPDLVLRVRLAVSVFLISGKYHADRTLIIAIFMERF